MHQLLSPRKGFTLIELVIVVGIIAILASMNVASLSAVRGKVNDARRLWDMRQLSSLIHAENTGQGVPMELEGCVNDALASSLTTSCSGPGMIVQYRRFQDPAQLTSQTPCSKNSITTCGYSISQRDGAKRAITDNYQMCFYLEQGGAGLKAGLNSITDGGTFRAGCR